MRLKTNQKSKIEEEKRGGYGVRMRLGLREPKGRPETGRSTLAQRISAPAINGWYVSGLRGVVDIVH